jgi:hypothetical protein
VVAIRSERLPAYFGMLESTPPDPGRMNSGPCAGYSARARFCHSSLSAKGITVHNGRLCPESARRPAPIWRSRHTPTCCATLAATPSPIRATTPGRSKAGSATSTAVYMALAPNDSSTSGGIERCGSEAERQPTDAGRSEWSERTAWRSGVRGGNETTRFHNSALSADKWRWPLALPAASPHLTSNL